MKRIVFISVLSFFTLSSVAQIGVGTDNPSEKAILHLESSTQGLLIPAMTDGQMDAMTVGTPPVDEGMLIYNTTVGEIFRYKGGNWHSITPFQRTRSSNITSNTITPVTATAGNPVQAPMFAGYGITPVGGIIMWSGAINAIPDGWALCNGQTSNGHLTPDLRERFIVGAGSADNTSVANTSAYAVGANAGQNYVTLTQAQMPQHSHTFSGTTTTNGNHTHRWNYGLEGDDSGYGGSHNEFTHHNNAGGPWYGAIEHAGNHSHTYSGTTSNAGSTHSHENRPPYYALAFIMRVK